MHVNSRIDVIALDLPQTAVHGLHSDQEHAESREHWSNWANRTAIQFDMTCWKYYLLQAECAISSVPWLVGAGLLKQYAIPQMQLLVVSLKMVAAQQDVPLLRSKEQRAAQASRDSAGICLTWQNLFKGISALL